MVCSHTHASALLIAFVSSVAAAQDLRGLSSLEPAPFGHTFVSGANCVTNGATHVVGWDSDSLSERATEWTPRHGLTILGDLPEGGNSRAWAISADGSTIVGHATAYTNSHPTYHAVRFARNGGATDIDSDPNRVSDATSVSGDGRYIVGYGNTAAGFYRPYLFAPPYTFPADQTSAVGANNSVLFDISTDGTVLVGTTNPNAPSSRAFALYPTGTVQLSLRPGWISASAYATNVAGTIIVGSARYASFPGAPFIPAAWTPFTGPIELPLPAGYTSGEPTDINDDGSVITGLAYTPGITPFVITNEAGAETLSAYFNRHGIDTTEWTFDDKVAVSPDGMAFAGNGIHNLGNGISRREAFAALIEGMLPCLCAADFDQSGGTPDASDIDAFFEEWLGGNVMADVDCSGGTPDANDIDTFFQEWLNGGCD